MMVAGRLPALNSCICCTMVPLSAPARLGTVPTLWPSVPWQFAQVAAMARITAGSCAAAGHTVATASKMAPALERYMDFMGQFVVNA
jgi:hypothetical protein